MAGSLWVVLAGWLLESTVGWPRALFRWIRHPVVWAGALIGGLDRCLNQESRSRATRRYSGALAAVVVIAIVAGAAELAQSLSSLVAFGVLLDVALASSLLASRSLYMHVHDVCEALGSASLADARIALAKIVGRDVEQLEEEAISRAALESLAESASDGVVAPLFWGSVFGLTAMAVYKAINTLDSMIGHRTLRYRDFGTFAARLDDIANWIPARLTAIAIVSVSSNRHKALSITLRDAGHHRSPNAGWPESAMAAALNVRLAGPRQYEGETTRDAWLNGDGQNPQCATIRQGLSLYVRSLVVLAIVLAMASLVCFSQRVT